jgi:hypothetical protein
MTVERHSQLRTLEGHRVSIALRNGSRIDGCQLVSAGRNGARSLWLFTNGTDAFVPHEDVMELWEEAANVRAQLIPMTEWTPPANPAAHQ